MTKQRLILSLSVLLGWMWGAQAVYAQDSSAGQSASNGPSSGIEEVTVTAERRSENAQDVPISLTVLNETDARKIGTYDNMSIMVNTPGLAVSRQVVGATLYLRGVGAIASPGLENGVATYVDDVYQSGYSASIIAFNNIDRVEVLKGPQGTLFGRNATGGVIHIVTRDPSQTPELDLRAGYGNYNTIEANAYGTTGIGDDVAMDVAFEMRHQQDGWGKDLTTGQDISLGKEYGLRSKLKWTPTDRASVVLAGEYYYDNYDYGTNQTSVPGTLSAGNGTYAGHFNTQGYNPYSPYGPGRNGHSRHIAALSGTVNYDFGWASLKSVTAYRNARDFTSYDQDGGPGHYNDARWPELTRYLSEEVHLISPDGATLFDKNFHWLAGFYYLDMKDRMFLSASGALLGGGQLYYAGGTNDTKSYAGFFDATLEVLPDTNVTLGVRETADRITNNTSSVFDAGGGFVFTTVFPTMHANATKLTYRAILDHKFNDNFMAYFSASRGFKSGGFGLFGPGAPATQPEILDAYALGFKSEWLDNRLQANLEGYYYDYTNQQVAIIKGGGIVNINAAASTIYGVDASFVATPMDDLTLNANIGYLHGKYDSFPDAPIYLQSPATCAPTPQRLPGPLVPGNILCSFDASGMPTIRSPKITANFGFDWTFLRGENGTVDATMNYYHSDKFNWDISGQYPEPSFGLLSASLLWSSPSQKYDVQVYCTNCTNEHHNTFIAESGPEQQIAPADPMYYGVRVGVHF